MKFEELQSLTTMYPGEGMLAMVVCVNPTPACYDETLHALKFSALASEVCDSHYLEVRNAADCSMCTQRSLFCQPCVPQVSYQFKAPITPLSHDESRVYTKDDLEELEWEIRLDPNKCS